MQDAGDALAAEVFRRHKHRAGPRARGERVCLKAWKSVGH